MDMREALDFVSQAEDLVSGLHQRKFREALDVLEAALSHIGDGSKAEPVFTVCGGINYGTSSVSQMVRGPKEVPQGTKLYTHPAPTAQDSRPQSPDRDTWTAHQALEHELVVSLEATIETYGSPYKALQALLVAESPTAQDLSYSPCQSLEHSDDVKILQAQKSDLIRENIQQRRELEAYYAHKMDKTDYPSITGVHYWQGDGEDHLESLCSGVPVVIEAQTLRELLAQDSKVPEYRNALVALTEAEAQYRYKHDLHGSGHLETGRAWDAMRRAGDSARLLLSAAPVPDKPQYKPAWSRDDAHNAYRTLRGNNSSIPDEVLDFWMEWMVDNAATHDVTESDETTRLDPFGLQRPEAPEGE